MSKIIFAIDDFNEYPQQYMGPRRKADEPAAPPTWLDLLFVWEGVDYELLRVEDALRLSQAWFYHVQIQHWSDLFGKGPIWNRIDAKVRDEIKYGHTYWLVSFVHEGTITEALTEISKLVNTNNIPKHKVLLVTGASNLPGYMQLPTTTANIWQSNLRNIWQWQTGKTVTPEISLPNANKRFLCLNRKPREHRVALVAMLDDRNLLEQGYVSCHVKAEIDKEEMLIRNGFRRYIGKGCFTQDTAKRLREKLPLVLDYEVVTGTQSLLEFNEPLYRDSYFSVVTETFFRDELTFITEKIFRPIMFGHPFIVLSTPGYLAALREMGYETFPELFDESYDTIEDDADRLCAVVNEVTRLCTLPEDDLRATLATVLPKLVHNRSHFFARHPPTTLLSKLNSIVHDHQLLL